MGFVSFAVWVGNFGFNCVFGGAGCHLFMVLNLVNIPAFQSKVTYKIHTMCHPRNDEKPIKHLIITAFIEVGAGGETRTHTTFYGPRILSPVRLPFRHTGAPCANASRDSPRRKVRTSWHGSCRVSQAAEIPASHAQSAALGRTRQAPGHQGSADGGLTTR